MSKLVKIIGRILSPMLLLGTIAVQTSPDQVVSNLSSWLKLAGYEPIALPDWLIHFVSNWGDFLEGAAITAVFLFWVVPYLAPAFIQNPGGGKIRPTFVSLFGRYQLGPVNVYEPDGFGNASGHTINVLAERDKVVRVKTVVPWLLYRVELIGSPRLAHVMIKRSARDKEWCVVSFGLV